MVPTQTDFSAVERTRHTIARFAYFIRLVVRIIIKILVFVYRSPPFVAALMIAFASVALFIVIISYHAFSCVAYSAPPEMICAPFIVS